MQKKLTIPKSVKKYFWGDEIKNLYLDKNRKYIAKVILEKGDKKAINWFFKLISLKNIKKILPKLSLSKKSKNFWTFMLK